MFQDTYDGDKGAVYIQYLCAVIFTAFVVTVYLGLSIAGVILTNVASIEEGQIDIAFSAIGGAAGFVTGFICYGYLIYLILCKLTVQDINKKLIPKVLLILLLTGFFCLSVYRCIMSIMCDHDGANIAFYIFVIGFLLIQFTFFCVVIWRWSTYLELFKFSGMWNIPFVVLATMQICFLILVIFEPLMDPAHSVQSSDSLNMTLCGHFNVTRNSSCDSPSNIVDTSKRIVEPFLAEYVTIGTVFIIYIWNKVIDSSTELREDNWPHGEDNPNIPDNQQTRTKCVWIAAVITMIIYKIVLALAAFYDFQYYKTGHFIYDSVQFFFAIILVALAVCMIVTMWRRASFHYIPLKLSEYVILITSLFDIFWYTTRNVTGFVCVIFDETVTDIASVVIIWTITAILNVVSQTLLIFLVRRTSSPFSYKWVLIFLFTFNLAECIERVFVIGITKNVENPITPLVNALLGLSVTQAITVIVMPFMNLYRIYYSVVLFDLIRENRFFSLELSFFHRIRRKIK